MLGSLLVDVGVDTVGLLVNLVADSITGSRETDESVSDVR